MLGITFLPEYRCCEREKQLIFRFFYEKPIENGLNLLKKNKIPANEAISSSDAVFFVCTVDETAVS